MSKQPSTINELELEVLCKVHLTNEDLRQYAKKSFMKNRGNLRLVIADLLTKIQDLYMENTEMKFHLSPTRS